MALVVSLLITMLPEGFLSLMYGEVPKVIHQDKNQDHTSEHWFIIKVEEWNNWNGGWNQTEDFKEYQIGGGLSFDYLCQKTPRLRMLK